MSAKTLMDKIWDAHTVRREEGGRCVLYIDRHYIHEVTSPVAFENLRKRGIAPARPAQITATVDHNIPTLNQELPLADAQARLQVGTLMNNCSQYGIEYYPLCDPRQGIVHIMGPEQGFTRPGMTIVCGDSHTATHGAFGAVAFGIGTSEVEMVLASQCLIQAKPKNMRITVNGKLKSGVTAKDVILYIISQITTSGGTGYFIEFAGEAIRSLSMDGRMTLCNMAIECGARGGLIAPDSVTFEYMKGRRQMPVGQEFDKAVQTWKDLYSDADAVFDKEYAFEADQIPIMITYGTTPGMGMAIDGRIPMNTESRALEYMQFSAGDSLLGTPVDYVFVGSCTNGRIEDFRLFAQYVKGRRKASDVTVWLVPGSREVERQMQSEGLDTLLKQSGFELRQSGCSACLAMNEDKIPAGKLAVSTSNRNFEGRQGPGARTLLCGIAVAAAAALTGKITNPSTFFE